MSENDKPDILLTNDDGINAPGLLALHEALRDLGNIMVVAPANEMSAVGHAITLSDPLRVWEYERNGEFFGYAVKGTPADCVKVAYWALLNGRKKWDLVISGINHGANTGIDIIYSGTVSAATEGAILGVPSFAISLATFKKADFSFSARFARQMAELILERGLPRGVFLNINVPPVPEKEIRGIRVTRQSKAVYEERYEIRRDPRNRVYYWLAGAKVGIEQDESVDDWAILARYISVTPIHYDLTDYDFLSELQNWPLTK